MAKEYDSYRADNLIADVNKVIEKYDPHPEELSELAVSIISRAAFRSDAENNALATVILLDQFIKFVEETKVSFEEKSIKQSHG